MQLTFYLSTTLSVTIKQWLSLISVILALLSFADAVLTEETKRKMTRAVDALVKMLDSLKPRSLVDKIDNRWVWNIFESISYLFFLSSIYFIPKFFEIDLWELRKNPNEDLAKTSLYIINFFLDLFSNPLLGILVLSLILIVARKTVFNDSDDEFGINSIVGNGSLRYYFSNLLRFVGSLLGFGIMYAIAYFFIHSHKVNDFFNWLPEWIGNILGIALVLLGALTFGFSFPLCIVIYFSVYWFSLILVCIINILEYSILIIKTMLRWIYSDPKRSWAIITTLISLVVALGEFGIEGVDKK
jgi:hypothetical protein